jgi:glyoxylase-like metal-dependent hydrolase (beta-lactamase superfamily II)
MNRHSKISGLTGRLVSLFIMFVSASCAVAQNNNVITFDTGSFAVTLLSEGQQQGNTGILIGATEDMLKQTAPDGKFPNACNAFLVETGSKTVLFDAGYGRKLFDNLKAYGKTAADIDVIILTHMHGDHIGGLLRDGEKAFPEAELYIPQPEHDYWMSDAAGSRATQARNVISAYKDKLHLFTPGETGNTPELFPGIRAVAAYGHTPGHTGYMLESDGSKLFIWGDLTHAMAVQMSFPEVSVTYDTDPEMAARYRLKLLKYMSDNNIQIAGMHNPFPAIGNLKKRETNGYVYTPLCECEGR